ncbi:MAG: hypothetical protein KAW02_01045 [candidate division Zixibacteria bacterium]|nr:hypothetical protein [candidate division Zixibacteria bacterium]
MKKGCFLLWVFFFLLLGSEAWGITGLGIGIKGGMIQNYKNDNLDSIPTLGQDWLEKMPVVGVHLKIGTLRIIHLEASVEYAWKEKEIVFENLTRADFSIKDLSLNATAKYMFSFPVLKPYLGAGVGMHKLVYGISNETYSIYVPEDQSRVGFHGVGGFVLSFPASPLELLAEVRYTSIQTKNEPTRYTTILAGVTFNLP